MKDVFNENPLLKMQLAMCWRHSRPPAPAIEVCKRNRQHPPDSCQKSRAKALIDF